MVKSINPKTGVVSHILQGTDSGVVVVDSSLSLHSLLLELRMREHNIEEEGGRRMSSKLQLAILFGIVVFLKVVALDIDHSPEN